MSNDFLWDIAIEKKADKFADDKKITNKFLINLIINYIESFNNFLEINKKELNKFIDKANTDSKYLEKNINIIELLTFLKQGCELIQKSGKLNEEEFNNYKVINSPKELIEFDYTLDYAEDILKWSKTKKLNDDLQFILAFHKDENLRKGYFKTALLEIKKEEEFNEKDYQTNIFEKAFEIFQPKTKQYNYS